MQYSKLTVAGCAALMFGLIACSGEDGRDGVNGVNGLNGADGASCEVKSLKDESGYKILCGGDSVGVLLNGKTGATGKQGITGATGAKGDTGKTGPQGEKGEKGVGCSVAALADNSGYDVYCGSDKVGTIKNGTNGTNGADGASCSLSTPADDGSVTVTCPNSSPVTIKQGKDGTNCSGTTVTKDGRKGVEIACGGSVVDTLWNGSNGSDGSSGSAGCISADDGNGIVTVTCGDATPIKITKAVCGADAFDPDKKFCVLGKLYDKCDGKTYVVNREFCNNGVVAELCSEFSRNKAGKVTFKESRALKDGEFCWNGIVTAKCGGKEFGVNEYCGKAYDGTTDSIYTYCKDPKDLITAYSLIGREDLVPSDNEVEEEEAPVVTQRPNYFGDLVGKPVGHYDSYDLAAFYNQLDAFKEDGCGNVAPIKCGSKVYNPEKQFCDIRDERLYKFVTIDGKKWMAENLAFEYKLPKVVTKKDKDGNIIEQSLDQVMGKVNYETDAFENFPATEGRYYTWNSAMGVGDFRATMTEADVDGLKLVAKDRVPGACPAGWRLPTDLELTEIVAMANVADLGFEDLDNSADVTINFNMNFLGYYNVNDKNSADKSSAYFWSNTTVPDTEDKQAYGMVVTKIDEAEVSTSHKMYAFTIRCVEDPEYNPFAVETPVDTDGDGVVDDLDECPNEGIEVTGQVGDNGCPVN